MFINHIFATQPELPPMGSYLYEYVVAANGIFVRARRPGLSALVWVASTPEPVRGLAALEPKVELSQRVPARMLARMYEQAYLAQGREILFYLRANPWQVTVPEQVQSGGGVRPVDPYAGGADTLLELHSHHHMRAFFSATDNAEESTGFRLYAVIGGLYDRPEIRVRVGIYGHFYEIPAAWGFDLPGGVSDALYPEPEPEGIPSEKYEGFYELD